jgi:hypothetical protein
VRSLGACPRPASRIAIPLADSTQHPPFNAPMWQRFDAILQLEAGAYACQDLDTTRLVPKALIRLSLSTVQLGPPAVNNALRRRKLKPMGRTTAGPVYPSSLKTVRGMIRLKCLGIFDQQGGGGGGGKGGRRERGTSSTSPRRVICQGTGGKPLRRRESRNSTVISAQTLIISSRPPDSDTLVPIVPERFGKGGPIVSLSGTVFVPSCHKGRQRLGA